MGEPLNVSEGALPAARLHIIVRVGGEEFAFPVADVEEALDAPAVEWVPVAPPGMLGQLRHRGRMVSAWDARWAFGLSRDGPDARQATARAALVLRDGVRRLALLVDDVVEIARVEPESVQAVPDGADSDGALSGVCLAGRGGNALVNLVRVEALVARASSQVTLGSGAAP